MDIKKLIKEKKAAVVSSAVIVILIVAVCGFIALNDLRTSPTDTVSGSEEKNNDDETAKNNDKDSDEDVSVGSSGNGNKKIVAYYPNWGIYNESRNRMTVGQMPWDKITHINHAFFTVNSSFKLETTDKFADFEKTFEHSSGWDDASGLRGHMGEYKYYKSKYPDVKILISVGGWTRGENFHEMAKSKSNRKIFIDSVIEFLKQYPFIDGIDIDWEYPGVDREKDPNDEFDKGCPGGPEDKDNFTILLKEIREAYNSNDMKDKLLTIANSAGYDKLKLQDVKGYVKYLDFINVMTYDLHGAWETTTNHHSALYPKKDDPSGTSPVDIKKMYNTSAAMEYYTKELKIPSEKLNVGTPFYSRGWGGVQAKSVREALYATATGKYTGALDNPQSPGGQVPWFMLKDMENKNGFEKYYDEEAEAPYLFNKEQGIFLTYEDERSLKAKCDYVLKNDFGGMILWEITGDSIKDKFPMVSIIHNKFGNKANSENKEGNTSAEPKPNNQSNETSSNETQSSTSQGDSQESGVPGKPALTHSNWDEKGSFKVTMNLWWGENGSECVLYENNVEIGRVKLKSNGTQAQEATFDVLSRSKGDYTYHCELINSKGKTSSDKLEVTVK